MKILPPLTSVWIYLQFFAFRIKNVKKIILTKFLCCHKYFAIQQYHHEVSILIVYEYCMEEVCSPSSGQTRRNLLRCIVYHLDFLPNGIFDTDWKCTAKSRWAKLKTINRTIIIIKRLKYTHLLNKNYVRIESNPTTKITTPGTAAPPTKHEIDMISNNRTPRPKYKPFVSSHGSSNKWLFWNAKTFYQFMP